MGGHEHHKSSRSGAWEGYDKLKQALEGLATAKGVSQSRIGSVAKLAAHYSKFYKHVVHDIEMFLWKAEPEHRLAGLYAIDAIVRQAHAKNPKDAYVKRFLIRLSDTIVAVKKVPEQFQPKVRHVIEEWVKRGVYTTKQIEDVGGREYLSTGQEEQSGNVTPRTSPGKLASLLSIIKQRKETEHAGDQQGRPPYDDRDRHQIEDTGAHNHCSYDEQRGDDRYGRNDVGGIMGDAPGVPARSSRARRDADDRPGDLDDRDPKKARGSRWGPPKLDHTPNDRPAPIITSLDRAGGYRLDSGRSGYGSPRQPPLLQSPHGDPPPPRQEEWNRSAPPSRGSGAGWPRDNARSPQSGGLGRHNASPYDQGGMQRSPFSGSDDRRSPGNRVPGTSGEVCRNYLAGRCTFGDRCWHVHDPQAASSGGSRAEMAESKRKTVLCNNYPLGKCRFGDKCSFAHGEEELDKTPRYPPRPPTHSEQAGGLWQPSPSSRQDMEQSRVSPSANSSQARSYGAPQVYNEPHGDRGSRGGDSSVSYANAAALSANGRRLSPDHQAVPTAPPQGYPGNFASAPSPYGATNQGMPREQGQSRVPGHAPVLPSPGSGSQSYEDRAAVPTPSAKVLVDDDEADTAEPEFTLEYDDED